VAIQIEQHRLPIDVDNGRAVAIEQSIVFPHRLGHTLNYLCLQGLPQGNNLNVAANIFTEHIIILPEAILIIVIDVANNDDPNEREFFSLGVVIVVLV